MAEPIRLLVGLGNPGSQYEKTRHNAGVWFVQRLAASIGATLQHESKLQSHVGTARIGAQHVILATPTTFMNHSGFAVQKLLHFYKVDRSALLVAHDEIDLPPGVIRLKVGGGHGGNNGLRHIIEQLGQQRDFARLRLGVGHPGQKNLVTGHVLSSPNTDEKALIEQAIDEGLQHCDVIVSGDFATAMNRLHQREDNASAKPPPPKGEATR